MASFPRTLGSLIALGVLLIACGMLCRAPATTERHSETHNALSTGRTHSPAAKPKPAFVRAATSFREPDKHPAPE